MAVLIVAECGLNHQGSVAIAKELIRRARQAGCDFVKFQKRTLELLPAELMNKPRESPWGKTYGEYREHVEFGVPQYNAIDAYCREQGIPWFASAWDTQAYDFLCGWDVPYIKIPSALATDQSFLKYCNNGSHPLILSTGMCTRMDVEAAVQVTSRKLAWLLQCTSSYPAPLNEINLRVLSAYKLRYPYLGIGFSNHTSGISVLPATVALGAGMIEFHVTLDRTLYGSDHAASIEDIARAVRVIRQTEEALGTDAKFIQPSEVPHIERLRGVKK